MPTPPATVNAPVVVLVLDVVLVTDKKLVVVTVPETLVHAVVLVL